MGKELLNIVTQTPERFIAYYGEYKIYIIKTRNSRDKYEYKYTIEKGNLGVVIDSYEFTDMTACVNHCVDFIDKLFLNKKTDETERSIKELLELLLDYHLLFMQGGLCSLVNRVLYFDMIGLGEYQKLTNYIKNNKPTNLYSITHPKSPYYWTRHKKKPRLRWLKRHVRKNR